MKISDEILSAFLDNELSAQERAQVQDSISTDADLAVRFEQLASVNALVGRQAALIDQLPMPEAVLRLLADVDSQQSAGKNNVVDLSSFRQRRQRLMQVVREHAALAASLALVVGFASGQLLSPDSASDRSTDRSAAIYVALDSVPSGQQFHLDADTSILSRFSFQDTQARYCRQYVVQGTQGSSENLACRDQDQWTLVASVAAPATAMSAQYQPASGPTTLDELLDVMMHGPALSQAEEQSAISTSWQLE